MTDTMSIHNDNAGRAPLQQFSWNPALRPEESFSQPIVDLAQSSVDMEDRHENDSTLLAEPNDISESRPLLPAVTPTCATEPASHERGRLLASEEQLDVFQKEQSDVKSKEVKSSQEPFGAELFQDDAGNGEPRAEGFSWKNTDDAAWEIPSSQNPFNREDIIGRTNSFPPMEHSTEDGNIQEEDAPNNILSAPHQHEDPTSQDSTNGDIHQANGRFWEDLVREDEEEDFFDQLKTQTKPIYMPPEADSRFEEGVPLVEDISHVHAESIAQVKSSIDNVFDEDGDVGDDFFNSTAPKVIENAGHPTITRKDTSQVLGSLNSDTIDSPIVDTPVESLRTSDTISAEQLGDGSNLPSNLPNASEEDDLAARWQAELDDDDLLLDDDSSAHASVSQEIETGNAFAFSNGGPLNGTGPQFPAQQTSTLSLTHSNPYAPHQPSSSELVQGLHSQESDPAASIYSLTLARQRPSISMERAESFVTRARDGYRSPYDLPEDLTRPRKPAVTRKTAPPLASTMVPPPPPRSSSIPTIPITPYLPPPAISSQTNAVPPAMEAGPVIKNFYEELPPPSKQRPGSRGRYTSQPMPAPSAAAATPIVPVVGVQPPLATAPLPVSVHLPRDNLYQVQLDAPERVGPYTNLSVPTAPVGPGTSSGYSPKPPGLSAGTKPPPSPRYSPAPPPPQSSTSPSRNRYASQPVLSQNPGVLPFQPRTSSPLAHHEKHAYKAQEPQQRPSTASATLSPPLSFRPQQLQHQLPQAEQDRSYSLFSAGHEIENASEVSARQPFSPPANPYASAPVASEPSRRHSEFPYMPAPDFNRSQIPPPVSDIQFPPPRRSQTQSPSRQLSGPSLSMISMEPFQRPASVHNPSSPAKPVNPYPVPRAIVPHRQVPEQVFIPPTDGQELDPLERWKGAPIFKFGFGGVITSSFPQHIPRYASSQMMPMIKSGPGEVKVQQPKNLVFSGDNIVKHPGPLRMKSKKKDVIAWLSSKIAVLENEGVPETLQSDPFSHKRHDEKILLWKLIRILVEHDGALEGTADIQKSLRTIISPGLQSFEGDTHHGGQLTSGLYQPTSGSVQPDAVDARLLASLRNDLLVGEREKAVWRAVDSRLWGHAMIMSSTLDKSLWKQVVQEFIRREVRLAGDNIESLAALYAVLSGNFEECVDELVPPSARVGLQMISKSVGGPTKNALEGLDRWRETVGLILNNRSPEDNRALFALGQLLSLYGRTEAAHICYVFARAFSPAPIFGGIDDPQAVIVLLGTDHGQFPTTFSRDDEAILLTEVYEFATSVLAGNSAAVLPHLQSFKLQHAYLLAEKGLTGDAQQYCDAIAAILKATTKPSPYYHQRLFSEVDELSTRLRQAPNDGTSSWISKPSMEKVSGSVWAKFSSFVAGDESDGASTGSGKAGDADVGPFAKVTGTPTISRSPSISDLYGSYPMAQPIANASSRYAPGNQYPISSSPEQYRSRSSMESQRSPSIGVSYSQRRGSQEPSTPVENPYLAGHFNSHGSPPNNASHSTPPQASYVPLAPVEEDLSPQMQPSGPVPFPTSALTSGLQSASEPFGQTLDNLKNADSAPQHSGYEPPVINAYEPPSYQPDGPAVSEPVEEVEEMPKKKSFMNEDDDDISARAAALQKAEKQRRDREADDAFRKAAEADAQRPAAVKKGWFGGWFGGKKDDSSGGPIKAKLGEVNSFYYDPELKKWVNKKDPNSATASARATPPPPKGPAPPSRSASGSSMPSVGGPPMFSQDSRPSAGAGAPASRSGSPAFLSLNVLPLGEPNGPPRCVSTSATGATPPGSSSGMPLPSAPPTRPTTSLSNASSIDDLLGAPQARKGNTIKGKKKGRGYVDVMAK